MHPVCFAFFAGGGKNRKKKGPKKQANAKSTLSYQPAPAYYKRLEADNLLARATHNLITYAMQLKVYALPRNPFGSSKLRYDHRLQIFANVDQPRLAAHEVCEHELRVDAMSLDKRKAYILAAYRNARSFIRSYIDKTEFKMNHGSNLSNVSGSTPKHSTECLHDAPFEIERPHLESMLTVIERNLESVSIISKLGKKKTRVDLRFDFSLCRYYPWVRVTSQ